MTQPVPTSMDPSPLTYRTGVALMVQRVMGGIEILGVGLLFPLGILAIGLPIAAVIKLAVALAGRL